MRTSCWITIIYLLGLAILLVLSYKGLTDWYSKDMLAIWIVLPIAWLTSYFPMVGGALLLLRMRAFLRSLERIHHHLRGAEAPPLEDTETVVAYLSDLAASENRLPRFLVKPVVRKIVQQLIARSRTQVDAGGAQHSA